MRPQKINTEVIYYTRVREYITVRVITLSNTVSRMFPVNIIV